MFTFIKATWHGCPLGDTSPNREPQLSSEMDLPLAPCPPHSTPNLVSFVVFIFRHIPNFSANYNVCQVAVWGSGETIYRTLGCCHPSEAWKETGPALCPEVASCGLGENEAPGAGSQAGFGVWGTSGAAPCYLQDLHQYKLGKGQDLPQTSS